MMRAAALSCVAALCWSAGCREHEGPLDAGGAPGSAALHVVSPGPSARILYPEGPGSFVDLIDRARHGVVAIRSGGPVKSGPAAMYPGAPEQVADVALGTGFLIDAKGVFVLTTDHIAAATTDLHVVLPDHNEVPAKLVGRDPRLDIALLAIDAPNLRPLTLGSSDDLQVGEWLVVLGDPFGDEVNASVGIVSGTGHDAAGALVPNGALGFRRFLQTDARIHRGNSGGPVLDTAGQVVGVAVATGDHAGELSFAIPIDRVREVLGRLRDTGEVARGWLGVLVKPVTTELATQLGLPHATGALVTEVKTGSPAARGGVHVGDVILQWDHRDIDDRALPSLVASAPIGRPIAVGVWRNGAATTITLATEKMPE